MRKAPNRLSICLLIGILAATGLTGSTANAGVNRWSSRGPEALWVGHIAVAPSNPSVVYATGGNGRGIFRSADGGSHWTDIAGATWDEQPVEALAVDPENANRVWVTVFNSGLGDSGMFRTTNGGSSWTKLTHASVPTGSYDIAPDPTNGDILYAAGYLVSKSTDGGNTWDLIDDNIPGNAIYSIAVDPRDRSDLWVAVQDVFDDGGVYFYDGDQVSPAWVHKGTKTTSAVDVAMSPGASPGQSDVIAAYYNGGVMRITTAGAETQLDDIDFNNFALATAVAPHPTNANVIYAAAEGQVGGGVFKTTDGGNDWTKLDLGFSPTQEVMEITMDPGTPGRLYAGTRGSGIFKTTDAGATWVRRNTGLLAAQVNSVVANPGESAVAYAATSGGGMFKTTDGGATWAPRNQGITTLNMTSVGLDASSPQTVYASTNGEGVFKTTNGGTSWSEMNNGILESQLAEIDVAPSNGQVVYSRALFGNILYRTDDGAAQWEAAPKTGMGGSLLAVAVDPDLATHVFVGTNDGVYESTNSGDNFTELTGGTPPAAGLELAVAPSDPLTIYATDGAAFYLTEDGATWAATGYTPTYLTSIVVDPVNPNIVYIVDSGRPMKSTDGGATFTDMGTGLGSVQLNELYLHPNRIKFYAGSNGRGVQEFLLDAVRPPRPKMTKPKTVPQTSTRIGLAWTSSDTPSGVASHQVRYRRAPFDGGFGNEKVWKTGIVRRRATFRGKPGNTYCFSVRAKDKGGLLSPWSRERCAGTPVNDTALNASGAWVRGKGTGFYLSDFSAATQQGARLSLAGVKAKRIGLVVTRCPTCGSLRVMLGAQTLKNVSLVSAKRRTRVYVPIEVFSKPRQGTVSIVVTSSGRSVIVEGLGVFAR